MTKPTHGRINFTSQFSDDDYNTTYHKLKSKYAKNLIENWSECTDPAKYVHEDLGIASYLILLWKGSTCNFVDLGCGNGLLVYILTEEGHKGIGLDVRRRKIWDSYPPSTILKEETVIPSSSSVYPDADWLIGNHSDELTAWLPIMAARSNSHCQFFTIPCCPYKLSGAKFQRRRTQLSIYQDFLEYVQEVGELCGFSMEGDKMKIPSTKRICLIGRRQYSDEETSISTEERINTLLDRECPAGEESLNSDYWIKEFKPREAVQPVRNCTSVPRAIQEEIIKKVSEKLLEFQDRKIVNEGRSWNQGSKLSISFIAASLPTSLLQALRLECRGLQTLLKNHHQVFEIKQGYVSLRSPESLHKVSAVTKSRNDFKWKQKNCWFKFNHPDGCPLSDKDCSYKHCDDE